MPGSRRAAAASARRRRSGCPGGTGSGQAGACIRSAWSRFRNVKERIYDALNGGLDRAGFAERRGQLVASLDGDVLEIGAGTGLNIAHYRDARRVVALEPDLAYTRRLRERAAESRVPVEIVKGTGEALPFPDASFDHVVVTLALCSVTDLGRTLAEILRVLRPGGSLEFLEHVRGGGGVARWQDRLTPLQRRVADGCHLNRDTAAEIEAAGFRVERLERFRLPAGHPLVKPAIQGTALKV
ncbi:MAG: class I SAM-dependent methyltransferase [Gaiellaceae bacterium]